MKKDKLQVEKRKSMFEGRAVMTGVVAVTAVLCLFTAFEIFSIKMEWNVPALKAFIGGSDNYFFTHYREEEEKLELSTENVVWEEVQLGQNTSGNLSENEKESLVSGNGDDAVLEENLSEVEGDEDIGAGNQAEIQIDLPEKGQQETISQEQLENTQADTQQEEFPYYIRVNRQQNVVTIYKMDDGGNYTIPIKAFICSTGAYNADRKSVV